MRIVKCRVRPPLFGKPTIEHGCRFTTRVMRIQCALDNFGNRSILVLGEAMREGLLTRDGKLFARHRYLPK